MKKTLILTFAILLIAGFAFGEEEKADTESTVKVYTNLEEAQETGKPIVCFFYTLKNCACVNRKCKSALDLMEGIRENLPETVAYCEIEVADHKEISRKYRVMSPPSLLFLNTDGEQISRLDSWKIKKENIDAELAKLEEDK